MDSLLVDFLGLSKKGIPSKNYKLPSRVTQFTDEEDQLMLHWKEAAEYEGLPSGEQDLFLKLANLVGSNKCRYKQAN